MPHPLPILPRALVAVLVVAALFQGGCNIIAAVAVAFDRDQVVDVEAAYRGLAGERIAVLVAADDTTYFRFPQAPQRLTESIAVTLANGLPDATLLRPEAAVQYVDRNPYWTTRRPATVMRDLAVNRLVSIDLNQYRTHEPGNQNVFRGTISANVSVYEADGVDPDNRVFDRIVEARFPDESTEFGVINGDAAQIEEAVRKLFADQVAQLFYDHTITIPAGK